MRAVFIEEHGGPDAVRVGELSNPEPGPGEVRVRLVAASLNRLDLFTREGIPGVRVSMPHVLGSDGAGIVDAVGEGVEEWQTGDEVFLQPGLFCGRCEYCLRGEESQCIRFQLLGEHISGTLADFVVVPSANVYRKTRGISWEKAAAFPLAYQTAWRMIVGVGRARPGETVLIHGVGGGVGTAALQIAHYCGALVYVTSSSEEKLDRAINLGAVVGLDYTSVDVAAEVRQLTDKRGIDLVIDNVGHATWGTSIECVARGGRIVTCGATTGILAETPINRIFWKHIAIHGTTMANRSQFDAVARLIIGGRIEPVIDSIFSFDDAPVALARMEAGEQFGKIVVSIAD